jgi:heme-degrading monooxygenase HmoA
MILEIADIEIKLGSEAAFEAAVSEALPLFRASKGYHGLELKCGIEKASRYTLIVKWATLEDHTVHFRNSAAFPQWRSLVGSFFAAPPQLQHVRDVLTSDEPAPQKTRLFILGLA